VAQPRVLAAVLAAGESRRYGSHKLLQPLHGEPLILHPVKRLLASPAVDRVTVVLGAGARRVAEALKGLPVTLFYNPRYREGIASSVRVAAALALASGYQALLITPGDVPYPYTELHNLLEPLKGCYEAARPICRGTPGFPVALTRSAAREALKVKGDEGLRRRLATLRLYTIQTNQPCSLDVDTPQALREAEKEEP